MSVSPLSFTDELMEVQSLVFMFSLLLFSMMVLSIHEAESVSEAVSLASRFNFFCAVGRLLRTLHSKKKKKQVMNTGINLQ